jgi:hypothetical protein
MGNVSLIATGIDDVRELFSGSDARIAELRDVAQRTWPTPPAPRAACWASSAPSPGKAVDAPVVRPGVPTGSEVDAVAHGRDVPPDRLTAAWALVGPWLAEHSWGASTCPSNAVMLDGFDFDLAAQGVPAELGLRSCSAERSALPLKPLPGQSDRVRARRPGHRDGVLIGGPRCPR